MSHNVAVHRTASVVDGVYRRVQPGYATEILLNTHADVVAWEAAQQAVLDDKPNFLGEFTDATRADPTTCNKLDSIWNDDDTAYNYADGTNWRDAVGVIT